MESELFFASGRKFFHESRNCQGARRVGRDVEQKRCDEKRHKNGDTTGQGHRAIVALACIGHVDQSRGFTGRDAEVGDHEGQDEE